MEGGEVEMVMTAVTNTWVGIGWRPQGADKSCHAFPSTIAKYSSPDFSGMDCNALGHGSHRGSLQRLLKAEILTPELAGNLQMEDTTGFFVVCGQGQLKSGLVLISRDRHGFTR